MPTSSQAWDLCLYFFSAWATLPSASVMTDSIEFFKLHVTFSERPFLTTLSETGPQFPFSLCLLSHQLISPPLFIALITANNYLLNAIFSYVPYFLEIIKHTGIFGDLDPITGNIVLLIQSRLISCLNTTVNLLFDHQFWWSYFISIPPYSINQWRRSDFHENINSGEEVLLYNIPYILKFCYLINHK